MLKGKKIILGITGSIAAYKIPILVRLLVKAEAEVRVVMTPAAREFVSPLVLSTLSHNPVSADFATNDSWADHVHIGRWADVMVIAPLSCNTLAKMAQGLCDNLLLAVYLSAACPVLIAPAMDEDMWHHTATKKNLSIIGSFDNHTILPAEYGELASGLIGEGRMAEPETIVQQLQDFFLISQQLKNKTALVTAGPTNEAIDPVRFIGNHSSGKMGVAVAQELQKRGAQVVLILGPSAVEIPAGIQIIRVTSAEQMFQACKQQFVTADIAVMAAAVADYTPVTVATEKIKKHETSLSIELKKTEDILAYLGNVKQPHQLLIGFALETSNEKAYALKKLEEKRADMIVLNSLRDEGAGFGYDTNKITVFDKHAGEHTFDTKSKAAAAADIVNLIVQLLHA